MTYRFECPRCGHVHKAEPSKITHARYKDFEGKNASCLIKIHHEREGHIIVEFFKMVDGAPWKIRSNRVRYMT